jgi:hypothetical protein
LNTKVFGQKGTPAKDKNERNVGLDVSGGVEKEYLGFFSIDGGVRGLTKVIKDKVFVGLPGEWGCPSSWCHPQIGYEIWGGLYHVGGDL